jgi:lipoprotein-releasing system permease protein
VSTGLVIAPVVALLAFLLRLTFGPVGDPTVGAGVGAWSALVAALLVSVARPCTAGAALGAAATLMVLGGLGLVTGWPADPAGMMIHTVHAVGGVAFGALWVGSRLRGSVGPGGWLAVAAGVVGWTAGTLVVVAGARSTFFDPLAISMAVVAGCIVLAGGFGFAQAVALRRFPFAEVVLTTFVITGSLYAGLLFDPQDLATALNSPSEQVLVAAAVFPPLVLAAFGVVGASLGFLFFGSGRFEPSVRYELDVALRYLRAHRRDGTVGTVTVVAMLGVCLGVMALIVVLSIMSGFEADLKRKILGAHAHAVVNKHGDDFLEYAEVEARVGEVPGVRSSAAFVLADAMISTDIGLSGTLVKGIDPQRPDAIHELKANLQSGDIAHLEEPSQIPGACPMLAGSGTTSVARSGGEGQRCGRILPGIIIGRELSRTIRAYTGDVVKLVSPVSDVLGPTGPIPKLRKFRVAGIFFSGMYEYDAKFSYLSMADAQRFFGLGDRVTGVEIKVEVLDDTSRVVTSIIDRLGGAPYSVRDWRDMNRELFSALLLEKIAMFVALAMIVMVASFLIIATLVMIVLQRGKEVAILKSIGSSDASIMKIFVIQGLIVGVGGAILGVLGGIAACWALQTFGVPLDERIFYIERLPVVMNEVEVAVIALAAVTISYLATIYPALTAARLEPVEGLRDD